jgi:hypothetical protein
MNALRLHWDADRGWILDVPVALSAPALERAVAWCLPKQIDRWRSLPSGAKRDELGHAIELLRRGRVTQRIVGMRGDGKGDIIAYGY